LLHRRPASAISLRPGIGRGHAPSGDLLAPASVVFGEVAVDGYDAPAAIKAQWAGHHGTQTGDPAKLGTAIVQLAAMTSPPKQFFAGSDAVDSITADLRARLVEVDAYHALSSSTIGSF